MNVVDSVSFSVIRHLPPSLNIPASLERKQCLARSVNNNRELDAIFIRRNPKDTHWVVIRPCYECMQEHTLFSVPAITVLAHRLQNPVTYQEFWQGLASISWEMASASAGVKERLCLDCFHALFSMINNPQICRELEQALDHTKFFGPVDAFTSRYLISNATDDFEIRDAILLAKQLDKQSGRNFNFIKITLYEKGHLYIVRPAALQDEQGKPLPPVAYMGLIQELDPFGDFGWQIASMGVLPEFRRAGIGTQLLEIAKRMAKPTPVWLTVPQHNDECLAFLKAAGSTSQLLKKRPKFMNRTTGDLYFFSVPTRQADAKKIKNNFSSTP